MSIFDTFLVAALLFAWINLLWLPWFWPHYPKFIKRLFKR